MEFRFTPWDETHVETRDNKTPIITGLASIFYDGSEGSQYRMSDCVERIMPTAFDRSLKSGQDIQCLFNHNPEAVLGRTSSKTLELVKEGRGLRYRVGYDASDPDHQRAYSKIQRGDISGSSFGFTVGRDQQEFRYEGTQLIREIYDLDLVEVSCVYNPAYTKSTVGTRSIEGQQELEEAIRYFQTREFIKRLHK